MYIWKEPQIGNYSVLDALTASSTNSYTMQLGSTNFTPESANHLIVSLNGVIQKPGSSFTVSGSTITFVPSSGTLSSSDSIDFIIALGNVLDLGVPSDATCSTAKIVDGAVTSAKLSSGKILQVVSTTKTDVFTASATDTWHDVTGLTAAITPSSASSKILVTGHVMGCSQDASNDRRFYVLLLRGTTVVGQGDSSSSRLQVHNSSFSDNGANNATVPINYLDSPSSTSELTYKIQVRDDTSGVRVNAAPGDSDSNTYARAVSTITLMEVAG